MAADAHDAWLRLLLAPGFSGRRIGALLSRFGSATALADASTGTLTACGLPAGAAEALRSPDRAAVDRHLRWLESPRHALIAYDDPRFPDLLRRIPDPPLLLFGIGDPDVLAVPQLAIVGSRNPTPAGAETAAAFARHLAGRGLSIASGLANGIDAAAHRGALAGGGLTVAVCGTGLDTVYPPQNRELAESIAGEGLLLSELPLGTPPKPHQFPRRNRLISGISLGTLVVEAARRSGSLITARQALEQGREVFAVPGSIHNPLARGCHELIRDGAKLVESADDILSELPALLEAYRSSTTASTTASTAGLALRNEGEGPPDGPIGTAVTDAVAHAEDDDDDYKALLNALGYDPVTRDTLINRSGLTADAVSSMLLILELQGRVLTAPGGRFVRASQGDHHA